MFQNSHNHPTGGVTSFWPGCFNKTMDRLIERNHARQVRFQRLAAAEAMELIDGARSQLSLADKTPVARMLEKNPEIVRAVRVRERTGPVGLFAYLPLNGFGTWAVVKGHYDGARPDPAWICGPDEEPAAIAIWLIVAPKLLARMFEPIARLFRELCPGGCPIFSYGATDASASIQRAVGFRPAPELYPEASTKLVVARPDNETSIGVASDTVLAEQKPVRIRIARSIEDIAKVFSVRSATFQAEQACPYGEEFDGNDFCATQYLAYVGDDPAACIRIRYFGDFAKLERLAIRREYRSRRLSAPLVQAALHHCARKGFERVYGHSRVDLINFWERYGFRLVKDRPSFWFSDVEYAEIVCDLAPDPLAIRFGVDPMMSIRPEGAWDEPGPLDLSLVRASAAA